MSAFARLAVYVYIFAVPVCDSLAAGAFDRYSLRFGSLFYEVVGILTHDICPFSPTSSMRCGYFLNPPDI